MPRQIKVSIKNKNSEVFPNIRHPSLHTTKPSRDHRHHRRHRSLDEKDQRSNADEQSDRVIDTIIRSSNVDRTLKRNDSNLILTTTSNDQDQSKSKEPVLQDSIQCETTWNVRTNRYPSSSLESFKNRSMNDVSSQRASDEYNLRRIAQIEKRPLRKIAPDQRPVLRDASSDRSISRDYYSQYKKNESNRRRRRRKCCSGCSWPCLLLSLLGFFCIGIAIAAILLAILTAQNKSSTMTTSTTTQSTSTSSTSATTTSSTSVTSSTTTTTPTTTSVTTSSSTSASTTTSITTSTTTATSTTVSSTTSSASTSTTTKTSTTTSTVTSTSSTSATTTATTTTSTTTTTRPICNSACGNDTSIVSSSILAQWKFENTFIDSILAHNSTPVNGPTFVLGYVGQAVSLNSTANQYLSTSFIPVTSTSFSIDAWIYPTSFPNAKGIHSIVGLCPQQVAQQCLQFGLRSNVSSSSSTGYFGLWEAVDHLGSKPIPVNDWTHVAIVYSKSKLRQYIYVNGIIDATRITSYGFNGTSGTFYIGNNYDLTSNPTFGTNNFSGYIDQLTVLQGIRTACEVLNVATMASRLSFDNSPDILTDSGPNDVSVNAYNYVSTNGLKGTEAIAFNSSSTSYLQASGYRFLSYNDASYSLSLWVQPTLRQGILVGSSLGYDPLFFASNQSLTARVGSTLLSFNILLQLEPIWSHIVLTCSSSNGLRLYVNNQLVGIAVLSALVGSGASSNYFTLGAGTFAGSIDEWRVYSRELSSDDVCAIFTN